MTALTQAPTASQASCPNPRRHALLPLTGVRFVAAFYVVLSHSRGWLQHRLPLPKALDNFLINGPLAVSFFFLLSGFILAYTYETPFVGIRSHVKFWVARFARIYPVYLLSLLLLVPFQFHSLDHRTALTVLVMLQAWNPWRAELTGAWNYPAWSLSVEAFFYLCFPFLQSWFATASRRTLYVLVAVFAFVTVFGHTSYESLGIWNPRSYAAILIPLPLLRIPEFILGMVAGNFFVRFGALRQKTWMSLIAAVSSLIVLCSTAGPWVSLAALPFLLFIYCLASSDDPVTALFRGPIMVLLGGASYAVYLLQLPVRDWVRVSFEWSALNRYVPDAPLTPIILVLFSILIFKYWEEPLRRQIRRVFASRL
ncbi:MAG TPA: acyltransferase [Candidatus Eisenbacteria bacterium]|nr:acyltransferase [Candidatus Eisenbacteria bacterium]